jgi:DNA-directed RNA polymerase III subunit RPC4
VQGRLHSQKLYFFQFPSPFPSFDAEVSNAPDSKGKAPEKRVTFTADTKPPGANGGDSVPDSLKDEQVEKLKPSGTIGQLEMYANGAVKIRLGDNVLLDVSAERHTYAVF